MSKQYFIPQSVWAQVEAVEAAADQAVSPSTPGTWYAVAGMATQDTLTTIAPTYTVSLGAIRDGQTVGPPGSGTDVEASLSGSDGSPPGSYAWSATVNDAAASLPITAVAGTDIVLAISDATHPLGAFSASSDPVTVTATENAPAQMSAPALSVDSASQITATLAAAPDDGGSAITGYDLRHSTDEANWTEVTGITSPHAITGLAASTTHYVQTRAVNAVGAGSWSASAKAATTAATQLTATPNTSGTIDITLGDGTFTVTIDGASHPHQNGTWGPFDTADLNSGPINVVPANVTGSAGLGDTLTAAPGVWVWDKGNGTATTSAIWQRNKIDISGEMKATYTIALADDTASLRYQETATDEAGSVLQASNAIPVADFTEPAQMSAPSLKVVSDTEISVNRAAAPADGSADITQYDLRYSTDEVNWKIVTDISAPESITNLAASTLYYVQTRAMNIIGAGAWSASTQGTTDATAIGPLFEDDFTTQNLNSNLADDSDWTRISGFLDVKVEDASGTRVARSPAGITQVGHFSVQGSYPAARRVTVDLQSVRAGGTAGSVIQVYLNYVDTNNYTSVGRDTGGFTVVRHRVAGVNEVSQNISGSAWGSGQRLVMTLESGTLMVTVDGSPLGVGKWSGLTMPTAGQPGLTFSANSADTTRTAISYISVENP